MNTVVNKQGRHAFAIERLLKTRDEYKRTLEREEKCAIDAEKEVEKFRDSISRLKQQIAKIEDAINALTDA